MYPCSQKLETPSLGTAYMLVISVPLWGCSWPLNPVKPHIWNRNCYHQSQFLTAYEPELGTLQFWFQNLISWQPWFDDSDWGFKYIKDIKEYQIIWLFNMAKKKGFYAQISDKANKVKKFTEILKKEVQVSWNKIFSNRFQSSGKGTE